jgi:hypothetical protein
MDASEMGTWGGTGGTDRGGHGGMGEDILPQGSRFPGMSKGWGDETFSPRSGEKNFWTSTG